MMRLKDLPLHLQEQAVRQLSPRKPSPKNAASAESDSAESPANDRVYKQSDYHPTEVVHPPIADRRGTPNKTEAEYNAKFLDGKGRYEAVILRCRAGNYTPDWMTIDDGVITFHEVKGGFRFSSESRATFAFRSAATEYPFFRFIWACKEKGGKWNVKHIYEPIETIRLDSQTISPTKRANEPMKKQSSLVTTGENKNGGMLCVSI